MAVYTCTGYNDHYMYLNQGQQTIPNGLVRTGAGAGAGRGAALRCRPPHGASPGPDVPWGMRPTRQAACGVQSILPGSRGADAGSDSQDRPSPSENGASFGAFLGFVCG